MLRSVLGGESLTDANIAGPDGSAAPGNGGGIHVTGTNGTSVILNESIVSNNFAASEGGGLWNQSGSTMRVLDSTVSGNTASGDSADNGGGGIFNNGGVTRVRGSVITSNLADGTAGSGGGIFSTDGLVVVRDSTVSANVANRAGGGIEIVDGQLNFRFSDLGGSAVADGNVAGPDGSASPGNGGGLHVSGIAESNFVGSFVGQNTAASEGGGLWNQAGSTLTIRAGTVIRGNIASGNDADNGGGGIFNNGGDVTVDNAVVDANFASGAAGSGGGLFSTDGLVIVTESVISKNEANRAGGGIELIDGVFSMIDSVLSQNVAGQNGFASPGNGGGLHVTGTSGSLTTIQGSIVNGNVAANEGGGLWNQSGSTLTVADGSVVSNNFAGFRRWRWNLQQRRFDFC